MVRKSLYTSLVVALLFTGAGSAERLAIYTENEPQANFINSNGMLSGNGVECVQEIQKRIHSTDEIRILPWARAYRYITDPSKTNIALFSMTFTEERRNLFKWVGPVSQSSWQFFARADSDIVISTIDDAKKVKRIGTYRKDVREQFLRSEGFTNLESTSTNIQNLHKLLAGRITLWFTSDTTAIMTTENEGIGYDRIKPVYTLTSKGLYIAFHKNTSDAIVEQWRRAYNEMREDGTVDRIFRKWHLSPPTHVIPPSGQP